VIYYVDFASMFCSTTVACWKRHMRVGDASVWKWFFRNNLVILLHRSKRKSFLESVNYSTYDTAEALAVSQYSVRWIFAGKVSVDIDITVLQRHGTCVRAHFWGNMYATCNNVKWRKTSPPLLTYRIIDG